MAYYAHSLLHRSTSTRMLPWSDDRVALTSLTVVIIPTQLLINGFSVTKCLHHCWTHIDRAVCWSTWTHVCTLARVLSPTIAHHNTISFARYKATRKKNINITNYRLTSQRTTIKSRSVQVKWYTGLPVNRSTIQLWHGDNKSRFLQARCPYCHSFHQGRRLTVSSLSTCLQLPPALRPRHGPVRNSPLTLRLVLDR